MIKFLIPALVLLGLWLLWRARMRAARAACIESFPYQRHLDARLAARRPELTPAQRTEVFHALKDYFLICNRAGRRMVSMPSQVADDAWHEFILFTRLYAGFCNKAFGRFLHHTPAEAMASPTLASQGIKRAWRLACALEGFDPKQPMALPRLFSIDATLGIAGGFVYQLNCQSPLAGSGNGSFCASHIGCSGGCGGDSGSSDGGDGGSGCGGD